MRYNFQSVIPTSTDNMVSRKKAFQSILLSLVPLLQICSALQLNSCIRYETYRLDDYKMRPFTFSDDWFSHSMHFVPRKQIRVGLRTVRLFGCCDPGFKYKGFPYFGCQPVCSSPCLLNSHCSAPDECICDIGYHSSGRYCISNHITTEEYDDTTTESLTTETTSTEPPCNGSCGTNEECSILENTCNCMNGFQRTTGDECVPKCEPECQNADCMAPNTCQCWPHYDQTNDTSCHLQCTEVSCTYGECDENGTCVCPPGFLNNGNACLWAGDAILATPDNCDCWTKFVWKSNRTESDGQQCLPLCDGDDTIEVASECINSKHCQCYEGVLVCNAKVYKCLTLEESDSSASSVQLKAEQGPVDPSSSFHFTMLIVAFVSAIFTLAVGLFIWKKWRNRFSSSRSYNEMGTGQLMEDEN